MFKSAASQLNSCLSFGDGGGRGRVLVLWEVSSQSLLPTHRSPCNRLSNYPNPRRSGGTLGKCSVVVWDLERDVRGGSGGCLAPVCQGEVGTSSVWWPHVTKGLLGGEGERGGETRSPLCSGLGLCCLKPTIYQFPGGLVGMSEESVRDSLKGSA